VLCPVLPPVRVDVHPGGVRALAGGGVPHRTHRHHVPLDHLRRGSDTHLVIYKQLSPSYHREDCSVADPDPPDPHVFGPPGSGSGSISLRYGSGSFFH
jgi:hypothetical protein